MEKCELESKSDVKKLGRRSYGMKCGANLGIVTVRWLDNQSVQLLSTFVGDEPLGTRKR